MNEWIIALVAVAFHPFDGLMPLVLRPYGFPVLNAGPHLGMSYANLGFPGQMGLQH